nr:pentatricopeptide repeat-containing protein At5g08305 [Ipomoea batatas]
MLTVFGLSQESPFASRILSLAAMSDPSNDYAHRLFLQRPNPTVRDYNALIRGHSHSKNPNKSVFLFVEMLRNGVLPDHLTYPFLIKALAHLSKPRVGGSVHGRAVRDGFVEDRFVLNSLIHLYGSCGDILSARKVFDEIPLKNSVSWNSMLDGYAKSGDVVSMREVFERMPERDVVSWSSLIDGYVKDGEYAEALAVFERMKQVGPRANEVTMVSVLCACAHLGALEQGRMMHRYVVENKLPMTLVLRTSIVDMYAKSGAIEDALLVFRSASMRNTDVLIWNSIIGGLAAHGLVWESLKMYKEMQTLKIQPDEITYLCTWRFSEGSLLTEAYQLMSGMPMEPSASMLGALLSGCLNHRKLDLAEIVGKKLIELDPCHDGRYVGLSNVYALKKCWYEAKAVREAMETRGVKKFPGFSFVETLGALHRFIAHDKTHPKSEEIYIMLHLALWNMKSVTNFEVQEYEY